MRKGKTLTGIERVIAMDLGRRKTIIANFLKGPDEYGTKEHTVPPKKISVDLGWRIRRLIS